MSIEICIPTVRTALHCMDFFIENLLATAAEPNQIVISVSYHSPEDLAALEKSPHYRRIGGVHQSPSYTGGKFDPSANHSSAINALAKHSRGEIVIFSDYDMAFLKKGWDEDIRNVLKNCDFFGTPYAPLALGFGKDPTDGMAPWIAMQKMMKYQGVPNLCFFAIRREALTRILKDGPLTNFDQFLNEGNLPFRFVNTHAMAAELNLPLGSLHWMDTGYEISSFPQKYGFKHRSLEYVFAKDSDVFTHKYLLSYLKDIFKPEVYHWEGKPFLFHFKKGSMKAQMGGDANFFEYFKLDVKNYLQGQS